MKKLLIYLLFVITTGCFLSATPCSGKLQAKNAATVIYTATTLTASAEIDDEQELYPFNILALRFK